jgi:hypothetical protein
MFIINYTYWALGNGKEYAWYKGTRREREQLNGELREDVFCRECRYDIETCGYTLSNCPYRKVSQQRYLKKYGRYRETSQEETTKILPKYYQNTTLRTIQRVIYL